MAIPAGVKLGGGAGGGMGSSGLRSCRASGSSGASAEELPHGSRSQSAAGRLSSELRSNARGGERSYFIARCTTSAPAAGGGGRLASRRDGKLPPPGKTKIATTNRSAVKAAGFGIRVMGALHPTTKRRNYKVCKLLSQRNLLRFKRTNCLSSHLQLLSLLPGRASLLGEGLDFTL